MQQILKNNSVKSQFNFQTLTLGVKRLALLDAGIFDEFTSLNTGMLGETRNADSYLKGFLEKCPWKKTLSNPDRFFATLQLGFSTDFSWKNIDKQLPSTPKEQMNLMLDYSYETLPQVDSKQNQYINATMEFGVLADSDLKAVAKKQFRVVQEDLSIQRDSYIFTKLNHGFWEFFFSAYSDFSDADYASRKIRDRRMTNRPQATYQSGFFEAFGALVSGTGIDAGNESCLAFGIGIGAGAESFDDMLDSQLTEVSRGALMGMLSFWSSIDDTSNSVFRDGCEPRDVLFEGKLPQFMHNHVYGRDACLIISPSHLSKIELPEFTGELFHLSIPHVVVHQTWRVSLAIVLGQIDALLARYEKLTIIMQGANFATLAALALSQVLSLEEKNRVKFFDLGRLLDVARPDICERYPSFRPLFGVKGRLEEIHQHLTCHEH
jgi:hypothetical protein